MTARLPQPIRALARWAVRLLGRLRNRHLFIWDLVALPLVIVVAFWLRLDAWLPPAYADTIRYALLAPLVKLPIFYLLDIYRRMWRYSGLDEARAVVVASALAAAAQALLTYIVLAPLGWIDAVPRSIPFLDWIVTTCALGLPRFLMALASLSPAAPDRSQPFLRLYRRRPGG